jgi:abhydrolase domain-containing protein 12
VLLRAIFIDQTPKTEFAGIILCAPFVDAPTSFQNYSIGGVVPLLAPLRVLPPLRVWFTKHFPDPWKTSDRTRNLVRKSDRLRMTFVHAVNDMTIPPSQTDELFYIAVGASQDGNLTREEIDQSKEMIDLGDGGWTHSWKRPDKIIRKDILRYGGMEIRRRYTRSFWLTSTCTRPQHNHEMGASIIGGCQDF